MSDLADKIRELVGKWRDRADDFNVTRGDSEVEAAYYRCANELEALSREVVLGLVADAEARIKLETLQGLRKEFEQTKEPTMISAWVSAYKKIDEAIAAAERQMKRGSGRGTT